MRLSEIIEKYGENAFVNVILETDLYCIAADMIRLFARTHLPEIDVRHGLIKSCLKSKNVEIRDATIQAIEIWEDASSVDILKNHDEQVQWLAEYINNVLIDLEE